MRLIDADTLIEKCGEWYTEEGSEEGYIGTLKQLLDKQPTIEPKQGKWIDAEINMRMVFCLYRYALSARPFIRLSIQAVGIASALTAVRRWTGKERASDDLERLQANSRIVGKV